MIFSIQRFLEDLFSRRGLIDTDQYAVKLANTYAQFGPTASNQDMSKAFRHIKTTFFSNNTKVNRPTFEADLLKLLNQRFQKKSLVKDFPGGVDQERKLLSKQRRRTIAMILSEFCHAIEARAVDVFWQSRKKGKLRRNPELIGQGLLAIFIKGVLLSDKTGLVLREIYSGIGYVDIGVIFASTLHLVEMKILTTKFVGPSQLENYMKTENRPEGWLLIFDARHPSRKPLVPEIVNTKYGKIRIIVVDINPVPPSHHSR